MEQFVSSEEQIIELIAQETKFAQPMQLNRMILQVVRMLFVKLKSKNKALRSAANCF